MPYFSYEQFIDEGGNLKANFVPWLHAKYSKRISELEADIKRRDYAYYGTAAEIDQTLGRALGYPRYCDDQKNFPGSTDKDGVCTGEHVPETLAAEAARRIVELEGQLAESQRRLEQERKIAAISSEGTIQLLCTAADMRQQLAALQERIKELEAYKNVQLVVAADAEIETLEKQLAASQERERALRAIVSRLGGCSCSDCINDEVKPHGCDVCQGVTGGEGKG